MRFLYGRVAFFLIFGVSKIRIVLEPFWRGLGTVFGAFWAIFGGFWGFEKASNFEPEVGSRKSGFRGAKGSYPEGLAAPVLIVDQSIIDIIDR